MKKQMLNTKRKLITKTSPRSPITEQYRTIRTNINFSAVDREIKTLMVTSAGPGEGKSTTAANLAVVFAQQGKKVLLVDGDMRKPTAHYTFGLNNTFGLTTVLTKQKSLQETRVESDVENLYLLTCGPVPPNPAELLSSNAMREFLAEAGSQFDLVIFDTPPVLTVTDGQVLANLCDSTVLVVSSGTTDREGAVKAKELLDSASAKIVGVVLNNRKQEHTNYYYYYGNN
ncbi:CpsD/CapB family tyrosine-protein kinase [Rossellomorea vietnamensis]|uniref:non-specific protein-tyrosine kinase n=1 Tax=Rossellomorea vietnamensis TaxID=218284 RepID=A0A5D4K5Q0_9BACI|nr:CpsD/CapB family tyrosine-protein kinase [Rossellomorea vietnamensis]TYR72638.1 CpsD/CapB family tyrosine-protein kinase [Rossellomorea vietnamensis]